MEVRLWKELQKMVIYYKSILFEDFCNAGDPSLIPDLGSSPGEEIGYLLCYSWASLVAQMVKNPRAMRESWDQPLGWEDPLEEGMATHSGILPWRIPMDRGAWRTTVYGVTKSWTRLSNSAQPGLDHLIEA